MKTALISLSKPQACVHQTDRQTVAYMHHDHRHQLLFRSIRQSINQSVNQSINQ